jgi:hypothetical protein
MYYIYYNYIMLRLKFVDTGIHIGVLDRFQNCVGLTRLFVVYVAKLVVAQDCGVSNGRLIHK